jgi:hypothetical protein
LIKQLNEPIPIELIEFKLDEFVIISHKHCSHVPFIVSARELYTGRYNATLFILPTVRLLTLMIYSGKRITKNKNNNIIEFSV